MKLGQICLLSCALILPLAGGCGSKPAAAEPNGLLAADQPSAESEEREFTPDQMAFTELQTGKGLQLTIQGRPVHVGDPVDDVFALEPKPHQAFPMTEVPAGLSPAFQVKGWEARLGSIGFIGARNRLALMLRILDQADRATIDEQVTELTNANGEAISVSEGTVNYWFWEKEGTRIMVCSTPGQDGKQTMAVALGNAALMTALRMNPALARDDAKEAWAELSRESEAKTKAETKEQSPASR